MKKRLVSSIILIGIFIPMVILGKVPFLIFSTILALLALNELYNLEKKIPKYLKYIGYFIVVYLICYNYQDLGIPSYLNSQTIIFIFFIYSALLVIIGNFRKYDYKDSIYLIFSTILIGLLFKNLIYVRNISMMMMFYVLIVSSTTDTFAYLVGCKLGKNKLSPAISPNKTIEGSIGGTIIGTIISVAFYLIFISSSVNILGLTLFTLILTILGQIGDLFFSSIKRSYGIKDFSEIIPGHGGILDRFDSVLFVMIGYMFIMLF